MMDVCFEVDILRAAGPDVGRWSNDDEMQHERKHVLRDLDEMLKFLVSSPDMRRAISPADNCGCGVS